MVKEIKLKNGLTVLVDDEDYPVLSQWNWFTLDKRNYVKTNFKENGKQKPVYMHRFVTQAPKGMVVDHINGNPLDNRKENLRVCTQSENMKNSTKSRRNNSTGFKGVSLKKDKFQVKISHNYKQIHVGLFNTVEEAARAYNEAALKYHGEFARLNEL